MRLLVISDIHAMSKDLEALKGYAGPSGGLLKVENRLDVSNPLLSVAKALRDQAGSIDALLCLGDLAHQGKRLPLMVAWSDIHSVARALEIPEVIGITGNHDVMSRANNADDVEDRADFVQHLSPEYPTQDSTFNQNYFATGVASTVLQDCLFVAVNTCRTHGLGLDRTLTQEIFEKGVLTDAMIDAIVSAVESCGQNHVVLAMHHHPLAHPNDSPSEPPIPKGTVLIDQLGKLGKNILILHGHQHRVRRHTPSGSPNPPLIISSASLCAFPYPGQATDFSNQFHLVEFDVSVSHRPTGKILSWDWGATGWEKSKRPHMPHEVHFGPNIEVPALANALRALPRQPVYFRQDLESALDDLKFFDLQKVDELNAALEHDGLKLFLDSGRIKCLIYEEDLP